MKLSKILSTKTRENFFKNSITLPSKKFPDIVIAILMTTVLVQTGVISALSLIAFMRNFVVEERVIAFVLYYIKEKTIASVMTVRTAVNSIISCKLYFIFR